MLPSLRDTIEDLRRSLQPKESALEALQQSLSEKEQVQVQSISSFSLLKCSFDLDLLYVYLVFFLAVV